MFIYFNLCFNITLKHKLVRKDMYVNEHERIFNITLRHRLVRKDMYVNEHERLFNITLKHKLVRKDMYVNEHERLFNITLKSLMFIYFNLCLSVMLSSLSCSFTLIYV
jgi:hypothetical protein